MLLDVIPAKLVPAGCEQREALQMNFKQVNPLSENILTFRFYVRKPF
jgi:hypothetical protein